MLRKYSLLLFIAVIVPCILPTNGSTSNVGRVFSFENQEDLARKSIELIDRTSLHRVKRETATGGVGNNYTLEDNHDYYTKRIGVTHPQTRFLTKEFDRIFTKYEHKSHDRMNNAHRLAWIVPMKFSFPFYGHSISHMVITTAGYLYANNVTHSYLGFAQYIAPLMADFDTYHADSRIKYVDAEDSFWVRWENLQLNESRAFGNFTFQCALFKNGSIVFDYISVPARTSTIRDVTKYKVAVGLSDAYYMDTDISATQIRRLIVRYHTIEIDLAKITNETVVNFTHQTTCNQLHTCNKCLNPALAKNFNCSWCEELKSCSSGVDRKVQIWTDHGCHKKDGNDCRRPSRWGVVLAVVLALMLAGAVAALVMLLVYAYRNPTSGAGQWLINHRPTQLRRRLANVSFFKSGGDEAGGDPYKVKVDQVYDNMEA